MNKKIILLLVIIIGSAYPIQVYVSDQVSILKFEEIQIGFNVWVNQTDGNDFTSYLNWSLDISQDKITAKVSWDNTNPEVQFLNITIVIFNPENATYSFQTVHKSGPEIKIYDGQEKNYSGALPVGMTPDKYIQIYPGTKNNWVTLELFRE